MLLSDLLSLQRSPERNPLPPKPAAMQLACALFMLSVSSSAAWMVPAAAPRPSVVRQLRGAALRMAEEEGFTFGEAEGVTAETTGLMVEEEREMTEKEKEIAALKAAEKFMMKDTGDAVCRVCNFKYSMLDGDGYIPRNTPFDLLPESYVCPQCKSPRAFFDPVQIEIAGFADNQAYGIGTNTWTEAQKSNAIFGGLAAFFLLFMSGYALN